MNSRQEKEIYIFMKIRAQLADKRNMLSGATHRKKYSLKLHTIGVMTKKPLDRVGHNALLTTVRFH